jgi:hypothetical protein
VEERLGWELLALSKLEETGSRSQAPGRRLIFSAALLKKRIP